jgi:N-methylhydantoinase A
MRRVYVPTNPGLLSAWGMLAAEVVRDESVTVREASPTDAAIERALRPLGRRLSAALRRDGVTRPAIESSLDVRYAGQSYEVQVPFARGWRGEFHRRHERLYGHAAPGRPIEVVSVRMRGRGGGRLPPTPRLARRQSRPVARTRAWFGRWLGTPVWDRDELGAGWRADGPLVVCELSATTVVPPGWGARTDALGGLLLEAGHG